VLIAFLYSCRVGYISGCICLLFGGFLREVIAKDAHNRRNFVVRLEYTTYMKMALNNVCDQMWSVKLISVPQFYLTTSPLLPKNLTQTIEDIPTINVTMSNSESK